MIAQYNALDILAEAATDTSYRARLMKNAAHENREPKLPAIYRGMTRDEILDRNPWFDFPSDESRKKNAANVLTCLKFIDKMFEKALASR